MGTTSTRRSKKTVYKKVRVKTPNGYQYVTVPVQIETVQTTYRP